MTTAISLYWCRRQREGQRELSKESFQFLIDESGEEYVPMTHDEATENHPGGIEDIYKQCRKGGQNISIAAVNTAFVYS